MAGDSEYRRTQTTLPQTLRERPNTPKLSKKRRHLTVT
jgi:hypothetical protein